MIKFPVRTFNAVKKIVEVLKKMFFRTEKMFFRRVYGYYLWSQCVLELAFHNFVLPRLLGPYI